MVLLELNAPSIQGITAGQPPSLRQFEYTCFVPFVNCFPIYTPNLSPPLKSATLIYKYLYGCPHQPSIPSPTSSPLTPAISPRIAPSIAKTLPRYHQPTHPPPQSPLNPTLCVYPLPKPLPQPYLPLMPLITAANAREMAAKARASRVRNRQQALLAASLPPPQPPSPPPVSPQPQPPPAQITPADDFILRKRDRVRGQIEVIEGRIDKCDDARDLDRLSAALGRLYNIERLLAGRPLPGTLKPLAPEVGRGGNGKVRPRMVEEQAGSSARPEPANPEDLLMPGLEDAG